MLVNREISLIERDLVRKLQAVRRWLLEQREEIKAYRRFRWIVALTERDRDIVKRISGADTIVEVLPFSLDTARYEHPGGERRDREVLFVGAMGATFNRDAVDFLVRRICPRLDHIEGLSVTIVGGDLPGELSALASSFQAEVVGSVEDIRPFLYRASCLVVPLRFGGGLRIRILEAMLAGLPVVCSPVAIAGMPFEEGEDYLLAKTPDEFAGQIEALVKDGELGRRLAESARRRALKAYGDMGKQNRAAALFQRFIDS
jgi:glycosyltransferase involved in cell wall biosynthesis